MDRNLRVYFGVPAAGPRAGRNRPKVSIWELKSKPEVPSFLWARHPPIGYGIAIVRGSGILKVCRNVTSTGWQEPLDSKCHR